MYAYQSQKYLSKYFMKGKTQLARMDQSYKNY